MTSAISAFLSAALALAGALLPIGATAQDFEERPPAVEAAVQEDPPWVAPPDLERRVREITDDLGKDSALQRYTSVLLILTIVVAVLIFISGLDDTFIDAYYWLARVGRRKTTVRAAELSERPQAAFAIMVPAWKEHDVIAAMIENTVSTLDYGAYRIFCGVYPNDPATRAEVDRMARRYPGRVTRVDVPHDGPTCKADCLNHIARRVLWEDESGPTRFAGVVLHDCEDVIHPLELKLFNELVPGRDLVQLPVFSLDRAWTDFTAGTYIDDFAECHGKDIAVREALVGVVPGAGVATCYSRACMAALWFSSAGEPFNTASLTEDYDLSFRAKALGMSETFAHVSVDDPAVRAPAVRGRTGRVIATHEYFPDRFRAAYRQRARWAIGIAFQGWRHMRWRGTPLERYFLFRDRKSLVMAPAGMLAYALLFAFVLGMAFGSAEHRSALESTLSYALLPYLLLVNLAFMLNRALQRMVFVGRYYGVRQALLSLVRMPVNNLVNFCAVTRAWRLYLVHLATGKKLAWDKTAHVYPDAPAAAPVAVKTAAMVAMVCSLCLFAEGAIAAPPPLSGRAYELADQAYKAIESGDLERAMRLSADALKLAPGHPSLLLIQADILSRQKRNAEAVERVRALSPADLGVQGLAQRGYIWLGAGNDAAAEADFAAAMKMEGLSAEQRSNVSSELAYLALRRKDDAAALKWFQTALESPRPGVARAGLYADAGYAATRLGENRAAVAMFSKAVDEWHAAPEGKKPFDETALFGMRRSIDSLSRRWGAIFSIGHSSTQAATGTGLAAAGADLRVVQAGGEIYYTPERFGFRDGRIFQWYANSFLGLSANEEGYATGGESAIAGFGARYKPLREHNLVFALERRFAVGERAGENDWLARAGWSASRQTDWNPTRDSWTTWQVYTESVYFVDAARLIQPFEARVGRSWKLERWPGTVATPYFGIAGEYDRFQVPETAAGIGPGLALRHWFRETRSRAFASYVDFTIQYRYRLTDARRGGGLFAQLSASF